ncbi:MAG TPA: ATP-binding protein [Phototrophicaceae bacterium]|nr:ATP-binding protein [Phototrophicaceae bacterium]
MSDYDQLFAQNKRKTAHIAAINAVAASVSQSLDLGQTLQTALESVLDITEAEAGGISLIDPGSGDVVMRAQQGWIHDFVNQNPMRIPRGQGMSGQVIRSDDVVVENNLDGSQAIAVPRFYDEAFRSIVMTPMHARGQIIGILSIMSYEPHRFDNEVIDVLRVIADTVGIALDNARLYETSLENQMRLSAILQATADGIIATDCTGRVKLINQAAAAMLDLPPDQLIEKPLRSVPLPAPLRDPLLFALSSGEASNRTFLASLENGRVLSVLASESTVESQVDPSQMIDEGWVIVLQDVTHLHEAEMARTRFIQAAAHDMRNPLGVAQNALDMLQRRLRDQSDATIDEIIGIAGSSIDRLQHLIDDLLHLEQLQSGYGFNLDDVDIGELIYEVSANMRPLFEGKLIHFSVEQDRGITPIRIDRHWVSRAISNYLDNAVKYSPEGSHVKLRVYESGTLLHVEVIDDGPGVPVEAQSRLFERFYRANADEKTPGTGLGLAIVKSVAEAHGGGVYLHSSPDQGSVFGLTLVRNA